MKDTPAYMKYLFLRKKMAARVCSVSRGVFSCPALPPLRTICSLFRRQGALRNPYNLPQYISCEGYRMCSTRFMNKNVHIGSGNYIIRHTCTFFKALKDTRLCGFSFIPLHPFWLYYGLRL